MKISVDLNEDDTNLLKCAFEIEVECHRCSLTGGKCNDSSFYIMGRELLKKLGIIE